ncbi:acyltransferase [Ferruginibacter sp. SUN106]|uniref:acyltransferase n=1 Tax=Ferruginibacter sp. SUN106 TaxID=2978348 RepID=UPI003D367D92
MKFRNLSHTTDTIFRRIHFLFGKRNLLSAWWWGVKIGSNTRFDGKCYFKRYPKSSITIGDNCEFLSRPNSNLIGVDRPCMVSTLTEVAQLEIGDNAGFSGTVIGAFSSIKIGKNVRCGANTLITDSDWHPGDTRVGEAKPVIIGDNVWLGINVVVLKGVEIGENTVIGANSLVTKSIPANVVAAGSPCKEIAKLPV